MNQLLILNDKDNIAVCLEELSAGTIINQSGITLEVKKAIPRGHKIATKVISKNEGIIKYGERMGHATAEILPGEHVHTHNVLGDRLSAEQTK